MARKRISLATRIVLPFILLIVLILGAAIAFTASRLTSDIRKVVNEENSLLVTGRTGQLAVFLDSFYWGLNVLSLDANITKGKSPEVDEFVAVKMRKNFHDAVSTLYLVWPDGQARTESGTMVSFADADFFKAIFTDKKDYAYGDASPSKTTGEPVLIVAKAVKDEKGKTKAAVCIELKMATLGKFLGTMKIGKTGFGWLVDQNGIVIAHPSEAVDLKLNIREADAKGFKGLSALGQKMAEEKTGSGYYVDQAGQRMIAYYGKVSLSPGSGWRFILSVSQKEIDSTATSLVTLLLFILGVGIVVATLMALFLSRSITKPVARIAGSFKELSEGDADLTKQLEVTRNDEIGDLSSDFNEFVTKLRAIVISLKSAQAELAASGQELRAEAEESEAAASQISVRVGDVDEKAKRQAESIADSSTAVEQIARNIESLEGLIADQAASVSEASASIEEMVGNIGAVTASIGKMAEAFGSLSEAAEEGRTVQEDTSQRISAIASRSESLLEANDVIARIASQTNLLAMNAAIEAAHAGESGRGFSVVADEIRKLAETAAMQSRTIGSELKEVRKEIEGVVGSSAASEEAFLKVMGRLGDTNAIVQEVRGAMAEQREGSAQILEALKAMNDITESVRQSSGEMGAGNKTILSAMVGLKESAFVIKESMVEMAGGATAIAESSEKVSKAADRTSATIGNMEEAIGRFVV